MGIRRTIAWDIIRLFIINCCLFQLLIQLKRYLCHSGLRFFAIIYNNLVSIMSVMLHHAITNKVKFQLQSNNKRVHMGNAVFSKQML